MSWSFSPVLVEEFSQALCSATGQSVPSRTTPTPGQFYWPDKPTEHSRLSRFGMTSEPLTDVDGAALLTWYRAAFLAKTFPSPAAATVSMANAQDSGWRWPASFAKWDPATSEWKTRQCSLIEESTVFSPTWPAWGSMRDGECSELTPSVLPNTAHESGFWQTPTTRDAKGQSGKGNRTRRGRGGRLHVANLCDQIVDCGRPDLVRSVQFRYSLMGWPTGWTDLKPLETGKYQQWLQQHGAS
jgi:hypothetical protein